MVISTWGLRQMDHCDLEASLRSSVQTGLKMEKKKKNMPVPQIHEPIESACPTSERQSCSKIYHGCSIAEMACFLSQLLPSGMMTLLSTPLFFLVLLSEVTTGKKGLTQFSFGAAQKIIYWAWWKEQET